MKIKFQQQHFICLVGGVFNCAFLKGGERDKYKEIVANFVDKHVTPKLTKANADANIAMANAL